MRHPMILALLSVGVWSCGAAPSQLQVRYVPSLAYADRSIRPVVVVDDGSGERVVTAAYHTYVVPESRRLSRGGLSSAARIDFKRRHAPLLLIGGEKDHIMPASLNRQNYRRYAKSPSITAFKQFAGRTHYTVIGGQGWEEVADYALEWATRVTSDRKAEGTQGLNGDASGRRSTHGQAGTRAGVT